ncbi:RNA-directed DNA polymerase, eukaryota [Tanacetum coccineum]
MNPLSNLSNEEILEDVRKSYVYGIGVSDVDVSSMASNSGCTSGSFPFTYLGLPIGSNMSLTSSWQVLLDRFQLKLSTWKANLHSIGGRYTLIKVVLGSLVLKLLTSPFSKSGFGGCYHTRTRSGLKLSKLYMARKEALITMVASITAVARREKDCLIIDRIDHGQWRWNWLRPNLGARNSADLLDMLFEISSAEINEVEDTCLWSLGIDGTFSVKDARCIIDSKILSSLVPSTVWDKNIPRKVNIFIWRLILDRLPHKLNLSSRGIDIQAISCPSCNGNVESSNHIFFECNIAKDIWMLVRKWCDISFTPFTSWQVVKEKSWRLSVIFSSSLWWLWRYRNSVTFRSHPMRKSDIFDSIRLSLYSWLRHRGHMICNWIDWLKSPLLRSSNGLR